MFQISIHALREERDLAAMGQQITEPEFQSTRSARSATVYCMTTKEALEFQSTRSARSATGHPHLHRNRPLYFNPRAPRGARQARTAGRATISSFQSTRSARSATPWHWQRHHS